MTQDLKDRIKEVIKSDNVGNGDGTCFIYPHSKFEMVNIIKELTEREVKLVKALKEAYNALEKAEGSVNAAAFTESNTPPFEAGIMNQRLIIVRNALALSQATLKEPGINT